MTVANAYPYARAYQRTQTETATPTRLVVMLYDGALRFLGAAHEKMLTQEIEAKHTALVKAQRILQELKRSLDKERGGEIARNLDRLYDYMLQQLVEANLHDRIEPIERVMELLRELRESWAAVDREVQKQNGRRVDRDD
jgi:flagellar protein FliS